MTRFEREISGALGEYWKNSAEKEVAKAVEKANKDAVVDSNGAISWKSNGNYLMDDFCEKLEYAGYNFSREATKEARSEQDRKSIESYKENRKNSGYSDEEMFEMRAAFGSGTTIVDIFSGRKVVL